LAFGAFCLLVFVYEFNIALMYSISSSNNNNNNKQDDLDTEEIYTALHKESHNDHRTLASLLAHSAALCNACSELLVASMTDSS
jgi:hypothetical protein